MPVEWLHTPADPDEILRGFHPPLRAWWQSRFPAMSLPQRLAIPAISAGQNVLVCAPTGTGKTLAAFISILSDLLRRAAQNQLPDAIDTLYISPLRALGADITRNLLSPLAEIAAQDSSLITHPSSLVRVALRTGDTSPKDRATLIKRPPHILITTPETLALCLANPNMRRHLASVRRIIIDELHALAPNKRGTDLMLSVERLSDLVLRTTRTDPQRIGLSATIAPLEEMAHYLVGQQSSRPDQSPIPISQFPIPPHSSLITHPPSLPRPCAIADASFDRPLEIDITSIFGKTPFATTAAINRGVYDLLERTIRAHRTTLVFTNVRSATERVTFALRKRFAAAVNRGEAHAADIIAPEHIQAHHSSLDRDVRHDIERRLKAGELRCVVCSTSLELGIDIGTVDHVVLLNSPKGVARGLQRIGRSGHRLDGTAQGTLVPTLPSDLIEAIVTAQAMRQRAVDTVTWPKAPLDVLAQHLVGMALQAAPDGLAPDDAFALVTRTAPYADLSRADFDAAIQYLTTEDLRESAWVPAKLAWHRHPADEPSPKSDACTATADPPAAPLSPITNYQLPITTSSPRLHPRTRGLSGLYAQNVGTITQEGQVKVRLEGEGPIGTVEEAFAQMLKPADRFVLGGRCVQFQSAKAMSITVTESAGQTPTVPRWVSGMMSLEPGLTRRMRAFRAQVRAIAPAGSGAISRFLQRQYRVSAAVAAVAAEYLHAQHRYAAVPVEDRLLVERVPDEGALALVFHTMIGRAANDALARVVAYRMSQRFARPSHDATPTTHHAPAAVVVDDYAFGIWIDPTSAARRADRTIIRSLLSPAHFDEDLLAAVEASELFRSHFRYTAIRAHALLQNHFGRRRFIGQMQSYATRLYEALRAQAPDHLLLQETRRTVLEEVLHAPAAREFLMHLPAQGLDLLDLPTPSPFAFGLFAAGSARRDTLQLADTADFLLAMYNQVRQGFVAEPASAQAELFS